MYERQFGLRENPFAAGHQSKYVYPSREHQEALAHLRFGIENREAFVLITGEVGTGKTTALYDALSEWKSRAVVALITNTALTRSELYEEICMRFGVPIVGTTSKPQLIQQLERHLLVVRARGDHAILLIDEAQNLDSGLLEETRLLSNLEAQGQKLLQIFLVGQPELEVMLERPELRQLRQRIAVHYRLRPLSVEETEHYIHHRISVAGGDALTVFPADACAEVHAATHGIPREINTVAAQALLNAFVDDSPSVRAEHVRAIVSDTGFRSVLDRPAVPAAADATSGPAASPSTPMSPPAAVSPVPVSPPHDVPAPTREVRQVPAPAPQPAPHGGTATPASIDAEGHTMAGVRPAGSTESWQSWMDSLAKIPTEPTEANADAAEAAEAPAEANATEPAAEPAEMSPEEFYAVEEAAMRVPIGDEDLGEDESGETEEYEQRVVADSAGDAVTFEIPMEPATAGADPASEPAAAAAESPTWMDELMTESGAPAPPAARSAPADASLGNAIDFEAAPGIQWGHAASRESDFDDTRQAEAMGIAAPSAAPMTPMTPAKPLTPAAPAADDEPAFMKEARNFAPIPETPAASAPPMPRPEPAVARVSAAPARPLATAQAMPMRLRERLEAAEREEATQGGKMTGWLIGIAAVAAVTIGILFVMRMRAQSAIDSQPATGAATTATQVTDTDASTATPPSVPPPAPAKPEVKAPEAAAKPAPSAPKSDPPRATAATTPKPTTPVASTTPPPAVKPATTAHRNVTTPSNETSAPVATSPAVVAPVVPKVAPKPAAAKPAAAKATFGVSVASFLAEGRAQSELARLSAATGVSGRVITTPEGDYRVVLGSYPDRAAAENAAGKFIDSGRVDEARVVSLGSGSKN